MKQNKRIFVLSAPSGTGKTTVGLQLKKRIPELQRIIAYTTRKPRPEEKNSVDYHFITKKRFESMIQAGSFAEWAQVYGNYYGTPIKELEEAIEKRKKALLIIDTQGGRSIKKRFPGAVLIGILPPSIKEQERRMRSRNGLTEKEIKQRLQAAKEEKKVLYQIYDHRLINKNLSQTISKIEKIITAY